MSNNLYLNRFQVPVVTGTPQVPLRPTVPTQTNSSPSFEKVFQGKLEQENSLTFSKHAAARVEERKIELSANSMARLNEGVRLAEARGLNDTLILIDQTAFIVSVKHNKVITTVSNDDLKGNVFTNIDGTVII